MTASATTAVVYSKLNSILENYKFRPLSGLLNIQKEDNSNANFLSVLSFAEEKINSSPKGRTTQLALLFYIIKTMVNANLSFYVKGGVVAHYYVEENCRPTYDLDIVIDGNSDNFVKKLEESILKIDDSMICKIKAYEKSPASENYYYDTFNVEIEFYYDNKCFAKTHIDGIINPIIFNEIKPISYEIPKIISQNMSFCGVPIEYVMAEKIISLVNELPRPYKHLVDVYGLISLDIDIELLKKFLNLIEQNDVKIKSKLYKNIEKYDYHIKEDKEFVGSYFLTVLQAGYNIPFQDMINKVNEWLTQKL